MCCDAFDILHQRNGRAENVAIDVLQNVARRVPCPIARNQVRIVDVAVAVRHKARCLAAKLELRGNGVEDVVMIIARFVTSIAAIAHGQSFSG
jgi:hypothetical protein